MSARVRPVACNIAWDAPCEGGWVIRPLYLLSFLLIGAAESSTRKPGLRHDGSWVDQLRPRPYDCSRKFEQTESPECPPPPQNNKTSMILSPCGERQS